ncbi:GNAT family N-acetyltransferase [Vibrio anguillarum]|uniref:GNAT family N-acetyltransferase n=2 Tax=Vibrio anguillarum TaxID=55601 RepID=A0AAW4BCG7_VIBAN|nr:MULTISPECIES: GNAT family N-acetyltransferase [unclassified Vibrio]MBF4434706.1 GNAT family N-acetyltransferase [Vibrio anguillarum]NAW89755.1 GNAT family N-acetyltransferase [Vibrio sp. V24_P1S3T111]OXX21254.1 methicillin resistance protein [Vibrio sp. V05_P4A8T149]OXX26693.1 methicillin resistance protein [Vibrio sp. V06_P1A73T115]OXX28356.1 methicillin resistance protein [Vibrio sp. V14_P6S14T42]
MINKEKYRQLCEEEPTIPIFSQAWWLDTVAGESWDVCIVEKGNKIQASMPYVVKKKYGLTLLTQPSLTQNLGPWIRPAHGKYSKQLSREKDLMEALIEQLPQHHYFNQNWHYSNTNWLPFYWKGFEQSTRYTYVISSLDDINSIWEETQDNIRREIRKAENRFGLVVNSDLPISDFFELNQLTFSRQGLSMPYSEHFVENIVNQAKKRKQCRWFIAQDNEGRNHAGVLLVWDSESAYYLMGGGDPDLRNSGATSLCMWEAIKFASTVTKRFDFEGSMIEPVERFFRAFGAKQTPYFALTHRPSRWLNTAIHFKKALKGQA